MMKFLLLASFLVASAAYARDASEFGFSPTATGLENAAALQRAFDAGGTVTVSVPGDYRIGGTVYVGDNTTLDCGAGVRFVKSKEGGLFSHVITNKGALTKSWNKNIVIRGLEIVVNGMDTSGVPVFGLRGQLAFFYVKDLRIERFRCLDLGRNQYCIHVCTFEDVIVDDVRIFGWKDGVHLGRGRRFTVRNGVFDTGDDPIALNAHDYASGNPELGWIEDGVIENCHDLYNPDRRVGFFCRILAGAWCDWREGMVVQHGDTVVTGGKLYRVAMKPDGRTYVSKMRPNHERGFATLDGIRWVCVQDEVVYGCGVRNVVFRDCFLNQPRGALFSVHYDMDRFSRSHYPGAQPPLQEGISFENVQVLCTNDVPFLKVTTPVDSLAFRNCSFKNGGVVFGGCGSLTAADYGPTLINFTGCRFSASACWPLLDNQLEDKKITLRMSGSTWTSTAFSAEISGFTNGCQFVTDIPGVRGICGLKSVQPR